MHYDNCRRMCGRFGKSLVTEAILPVASLARGLCYLGAAALPLAMVKLSTSI